MKPGFLGYLATRAAKYWQAGAVAGAGIALCTVPETPFWLQLLIQLAVIGLVQTVIENVQLRERVARLEALLTSLDAESAFYRKEIQDYDASLKPHLSATPRRENSILLPDGFHEPVR